MAAKSNLASRPSLIAYPTTPLDPLFTCLDRLGVCRAYEEVTNFFSPHLRGLTPAEFAFLRPIFGASIPYARVRIDERAHLGPRRWGFYYVSFHTVNSWGAVPPPILVHEIVHVWQYVHLGAVYIPRALAAQCTPEGYDYGGAAGLRRAGSLLDFNYEQMASVIEDAFRLRYGYRPRWIRGGPEQLPLFAPFLRELRGA